MKKSLATLISFLLLLGWIVPYGSPSAYASQMESWGAGGMRIAAGASYSLLLKPNGTVVAWGGNNYGQTDVPAGLTGVAAIAAGSEYVLALKSDGHVVAWGADTFGQSTLPPAVEAGGVTSIAAGGNHALALLSNGTIQAWGNNSRGQTNVPVGLTGGDVVAIAAGHEHSLALKSDGTVVSWGYTLGGNLNVPAGLDDVVAIAAGTYHSLALKADGTVAAWGSNGKGQTTLPASLATGGVIAISAGDDHSLALKADGTVVAWGDNSKGQLNAPVGLAGVVSISAGWNHSLALKADGTVIAWGLNDQGQTNVPAGPVLPVKGIRVAAGQSLSLALKSDGTVVAWGSNDVGQLEPPVGLSDVAEIAVGANHSLALKADGTVVAWGYNNQGQSTVPAGLTDVVAIAAGGTFSLALKSDGNIVTWGDSSVNLRNVPAGLTDVAAIAAGYFHSLALKADGTVVAWGGLNNQGQINVPAGLDDVVAIAAGGFHSLALKSNGTVVAWGASSSNVPAGLTDVVAIAAGSQTSFALKADGTVVSWGVNPGGIHTVPAGLDGVVAVAAGYTHQLALKSDGTVVAWGDSTSGKTNVPGNGELSGLTMLAGSFTEPFDPSVTNYTYYYGGQSSVDVTPTLPSGAQADIYINNERVPGGSARTISLAGVTTDTVIPVRVEPYLRPSRTYTITLKIDATKPSVQFGTNGQLTAATSASSKITVSDMLSGVNPASLQYMWTQSDVIPTGVWTAFANEDTISRTSGDGNWYLHVRAADLAGNVVDAVSNRFVLDNTAPTATVSSSAGSMVNAAFPVTITFSEGVNGLTEGELAVTNGSASNLVSVNAATYTATITPTASGQAVTVAIGAGAATDAAGNGNTASNTLTLLYDTSKPAVTYGGFTDLQQFVVPPAQVSVSVSEAVYWVAGGAELTAANALPLISMTKDGDAFSAYTGSYDETSRTFTLSFNDVLADGVYEVDVAGGVVANAFHNTLDAASASFTVAVPAIATMSVSPISLPDAGGDVTVAITGVNLTGQTVKVYVDGVEAATATVGSDTSATATISLPRNVDQAAARSYNVTLYLGGVEVAGLAAVVTVSAAPPDTTTLSSNDKLAKLSLDASGKTLELSPAFTSETTAYTAETDAEQIELQVSSADPYAIVTLQGKRISGNTVVPLEIGTNVLTLTVQAEDGTRRTYTLTIHRVAVSEEGEGTSPSAPVCAFTDIGQHWAKSDICEAAELGIVDGVDTYTFVPNGYVTRTEFAVMLLRALQIPVSNEAGALSFSDKDNVPVWAREAIRTAVAEGVLEGYSDGLLRPMQTVNRAEMAAMLSRSMKWEAAATDHSFFSDADAIPAWAIGYVESAHKHGIIQGRDGGKFMPEGLTTRAEAAVVLLRLWHVLH